MGVPKWLVKCEVCSCYKGTRYVRKRKKDQDALDKEIIEEGEKSMEVQCLCDGILCSKCKKNMIYRPISNYYDEETGKIWHRPYFGYLIPCAECRAKDRGEKARKE